MITKLLTKFCFAYCFKKLIVYKVHTNKKIQDFVQKIKVNKQKVS